MKRPGKSHRVVTTTKAAAIRIRTATGTAIRNLVRMVAGMEIVGGAAAGPVSAEVGAVANVAARTADTNFYTLQHGV